MTDDEIYLACLLAIGPWNMKVFQVEYLMAQLRQKLGREPETEENMRFVMGFRKYCIDTHTVGV